MPNQRTLTDNALAGLRANWTSILVFVALLVAIVIFVPSFLHPANLLNVARQSALIGIIAIGMTFVILTGGIDLSVGAILAVTGVATALLINNGMIIPVAIVVALLIGVAIGLINGLGVALLHVQPFIMTLATTVAMQGLSLRLTSGGPAQFDNFSKLFDVLGGGSVLGIPGPFVMFVVVSAAGILTLRYLPFGRFLYAIGGSVEAARLAGVRTSRVTVLAYGVSGLCAGLAGVMTAGRLGVGDPTAGGLANLDAITAVVIGGTSLAGGTGGAVGTVFGALLLAVLSNVMNLIGISPFDQQIVKGVVIVLAVLLAARATRARFRKRTRDKNGVSTPSAPVPTDDESQLRQERRASSPSIQS